MLVEKTVINVGNPKPLVKIPMGGTDKAGNLYEVNNRYLTRNGKPMLPVMGEFHFSRWTPDEWEEALLKMKAGGVNIVATYVFWNHHEEEKGIWDFSGSKDIRSFLEICKKADMPVWLRIGPWAHGESRYGGFPDWLVNELGHNGLYAIENHKGEYHETRTNDTLYMEYVRLFWTRLSKETQGMMCKDGGPVLGIQLENEYCHAGGPVDKSQGFAHMKALKELAVSLGFVTPYYTATGWGGAVSIDGETLPVLGGYVDAPWAGHIDEMPPCENFLFAPFHADENIGADLAIDGNKDYTFSQENNPYLTAELGGGLQVTALRRTYPFPEDIEAQSLCMLGSGANLLGYYMYHGGFNPLGKNITLQEARETGYFNDLPKRSYDFQTCIRESGKLNESYHRLKRLHLFIKGFEQELAPAIAYLPQTLPKSAQDLETARVSVRYNHELQEGFIFINNHQRLRKMKPVENLTVEIYIEETGKSIIIEDLNCPTDECAIFPFGLNINGTKLLKTNARLLTKIGERYFFYSEKENPYMEFDTEIAPGMVVILSNEESLEAYSFQNRLYFNDKAMFEKDNCLYQLGGNEPVKLRYINEDGEMTEEIKNDTEKEIVQNEAIKVYPLTISAPVDMSECTTMDINIDMAIAIDITRKERLHEIYLHIAFNGDRAELYDGNTLLTDWFSNGEEWVVALKRYDYPQNLRLVVYPFEEKVYYDLPPRKGCGCTDIYAEVEYITQFMRRNEDYYE